MDMFLRRVFDEKMTPIDWISLVFYFIIIIIIVL